MCTAKEIGYNKNMYVDCTMKKRTKHPKPHLRLRLHSDPLSSMTATLTIRGFRLPFDVDVERAFAVDRVVRLVVPDEETAPACDESSTTACDVSSTTACDEGLAVVCDEAPVPAAASSGVDAAAFASRLAVPFLVETL